MGNDSMVAVFSRRSAVVSATLWGCLSLMLAISAFRHEQTHTGGAQSIGFQAGAIALSTTTFVAWALVFAARRTLESGLMGLVACLFAGTVSFYFFVDRDPHTYTPSIVSGLVAALIVLLVMSYLVLWQAFKRDDAPKTAK